MAYARTRPGWLSRCSDSLRAGRCGDRIPVGERFSASVHTGPEAHPYRVFGGLKRPEGYADHPPLSSPEFANGLEFYLHFPSVPAKACHGVTFSFTLG